MLGKFTCFDNYSVLMPYRYWTKLHRGSYTIQIVSVMSLSHNIVRRALGLSPSLSYTVNIWRLNCVQCEPKNKTEYNRLTKERHVRIRQNTIVLRECSSFLCNNPENREFPKCHCSPESELKEVEVVVGDV